MTRAETSETKVDEADERAGLRQTLVGLICSVMPETFVFPPHGHKLHLANDLGMDSLALISMVVLCEQHFGVKISQDPEFLSKVSTVDAAANYLFERRQTPQKPSAA